MADSTDIRVELATLKQEIENSKDIQEINPKYLKGLKFIYVDSMKDVISNAITNRKVINPKFIWFG